MELPTQLGQAPGAVEAFEGRTEIVRLFSRRRGLSYLCKDEV